MYKGSKGYESHVGSFVASRVREADHDSHPVTFEQKLQRLTQLHLCWSSTEVWDLAQLGLKGFTTLLSGFTTLI